MQHDERSRTPVALLAFGVVACLFGTFYFFGDIGKFSDDFFYNQRNVATGEVRSLILDRPFHVWRPLFQIIVPGLHTLLWEHNWAMHLLSTALHACVCWLLFRLLMKLGLSMRTSAAGALVFMLYPAHHEAVYWSCCIPTLMASCMVLGLFHWQIWWLRREGGLKLWQRFLPLGFAGAAFAAASLNEQPTGLLATLPWLGLVVAPPAGVSGRVFARRALVPPALAGLALIGYIAAHFHFTAHVRRGADRDEPAVSQLAERIVNAATSVPKELQLREFGGGALEHGMIVLREHWPLTAVFVVMALASAIAMSRWWVRADRDGHTDPRPSGLHLRLVGLGQLMFVGGWIPIVAVHDTTMPRLHYPPNIGLAIVAAAVLQMIANPVARNAKERSMLRGLGLAMLLLALAPMVAVHVGVQDAYRKRYQRDMKEMADLAALTSGHSGQMLFMPMRVDSRVVTTGSRRFEAFFAGCWHWEYAAGWLMQQVFKREDVHVTLVPFGEDLPLYAVPKNPTQSAILVGRFSRPLPEPRPERNPGGPGRIVAWEKIVPFTVSAEGEVRLCSPVQIVDASGKVVETFVPPIVAKLEHSWRETSRPVRVQLAPAELTDREHRPLPTRREKKKGQMAK